MPAEVSALHPVERLQVDANGLRFDVRAAGPEGGRPVVLLHGFPESSICWAPLMGLLADKGYRAIAPDQRGYSPGARPLDVDAYRTSALVDDVLGIVRTMELGAVDLVGHDWGGVVAWLAAAGHPSAVRSLTAVSTPHPAAVTGAILSGDADQVRRSAYIRTFRKTGDAERLLVGEDGRGEGLRAMLRTTGLPAPYVEEYVAFMCEPGVVTAGLNWYRAMELADAAGMAPVVVPTLYVWSTADAAFGRLAAERTAEYVAGRYQFRVLEGMSHWLPEEAPDDLGRLVLDHLSTCGA